MLSSEHKQILSVWRGLCLALAVVLSPLTYAQQGPSTLNVSGGLFLPSGLPVTATNVNFRLEIWDQAATCMLYSENHLAQNLSASKGGFALAVGRGSSANNLMESTTTLSAKIFENNGIIAGGWANCPAGANLVPGDERAIRVHYDLGGGYIAMSPDVPIASAAYSMVAETLQGKRPVDFIQVRDDMTYDLNQTNVENVFTSTNYLRLQQLLNPVSAVPFAGQRLTNIADPTAAQDAVTRNYADGKLAGQTIDLVDVAPGFGGGKVLTWDQTGAKWVAQASSNVPGGAAGGDLTGTYPNPSVANLAIGTSKLANDAVTSAKINSTGIATNRILITDGTAGASVTYATCANNEILKFVVGTGWQCATVASLSAVTSVAGKSGAVTLNAADIAGLGTASLYNVGIGTTEVPVLDAGGKLAGSTIPLFLGDVTGAYGANIVTKIQGRDVLDSVPNNNDILRWNNALSRWEASAVVDNGMTALTGDVSASGSGSVVATLTNGVVTTPKMFTNPGVNRLVATDGGSGATLVPFTCNLTETMQWTATGWSCVTPSALIGTGFIADGGNIRGSTINIGTNDTQNLNLETDNTPRLTILAGGNIGIGNTSPANALSVTGTASATGAVTAGTSVSAGTNMSAGTTISAGGNISSGASISATNNVTAGGNVSGANIYANTSLGVGTTSPARILEVAGVMRVAPSTLPGAPGAGDLAIDSGAGNSLKYHNGTSWISLAVGGTGDFKADGTIAMTGAFRSINGNAAAPGMTFVGDTANGIFAPASNNFAVSTAGAERMRVLANGNVGFGNTNPTFLMDVSGTGRISGGLTTTTIGATNISATSVAATGNVSGTSVFATTSMGIGTTSPNRMLEVAGAVRVQPSTLPGSPAAGDIVIDSAASNSLKYHNGTSWISLAVGGTGDFKADGTVGMTGAFRSINGNAAAPGMTFNGDTDNGVFAPAADNFAIGTAGAERMRVLANGNVGIGTTNPLNALDVTGVISSSGAISAGGNITSGGIVSATGNITSGASISATNNISGANVYANTSLGVGTTSPARILEVAGVMRVSPSTLPGAPGAGDMAIDSAAGNSLKYHNGTSWISLAVGGTGDFQADGTIPMTGAFRSIAGNASAPGVTFVGETDNGLFLPASDNLALGTAGSERMRILANGNIGVGTTNPTFLMDINGTGRISSGLTTTTIGATNISATSLTATGNVSGANVYASGNMGIGTTSPNRMLEVAGPVRISPTALPGSPGAGDVAIDSGAANTLKYHNGSSWVTLGTGNTASAGTANYISKFNGANSVIDSVMYETGGNVGVGTTSPTFKMDVAGTGRIASGLTTTTIAATNIAAISLAATGNVSGASVFATTSMGIGTTSPNRMLEVAGAVRVQPSTLPGSPAAGDIVIDSAASNSLKYHNGTSWISLAVGGTGDFKADGTVAMTGAFRSTTGSAASPGMTFVGDTDNGIFAPSADTLAFGTSATEKMRILANGNVGIGTTNPAYPLDVTGNGRVSGTLNTTAVVASGNITANTIYSTSNIGAGTTSPSRLLEVAGAMRLQPSALPSSPGAGDVAMDSGAANTLKYHNGSNWISLGTGNTSSTGTANYLSKFSAANAIVNSALYETGGNIGLGTTSPNRLLSVNGLVNIAPTALPGSPVAGDLAIDSAASNSLKYHNGSNWISLAVGGTGDFKADGSVAMTGALRHLAGNAAAPGMTFSGDTDNGIFAPVADNLAFGTSATEKMRILANGNVGIGTTNPTFLMDINGTGRIASGLTTTTIAATNISATSLVATGNVSGASVFATTSMGIGTTSPNRMLEVAGAVRVQPSTLPGSPAAGDIVIDSAASNSLKYHNGTSWISLAVGGTGDFKADGTVAMTGAFRSIAGSAGAPGITFVGDTDNGLFLPAADNLALGTSGAERMRILANGNVGIGNTNPANALSVTGAISASTTVAATGNITSGGNVSAVNVYASSNMGIGTTSPNRLLEVAGPIRITPTALPGSPAAGDLAFDSAASNTLKYYNGTAWQSINTGSGFALAGANADITSLNALTAINGASLAIGNSATTTLNVGGAATGNLTSTFGANSGTSATTLQSGTGGVGIGSSGTTTNAINLSVSGVNGGINLAPNGTGVVTSTRPIQITPTALPGSPNAGYVAMDSAAANSMKYFNGTSWVTLGTGNTASAGTANYISKFNGANSIINSALYESGGNVGIGTTSPSRLLSVNGSINVSPSALPGSPAAGDIVIDSAASNSLKYHNGSNWVSLAVGGTGDFKADGTVAMTGAFRSIAGSAGAPGMTFVGDTDNGIFAPAADNLAFGTSASEKMRILAGGNVGIGNTNPASKLDVSGSINTSGDFWVNGNSVLGRSGSKVVIGDVGSNALTASIYSNGAERVTIDSSGRMGIGVTAPTRLLQVAGALKITPTANPGTPTAGDLFVDSTSSNALKYHNGSSWVSVGSGSGDFLKNGSVVMTGTFQGLDGVFTSNSATALAVGLNGVTNPAFVVDASTASSATGVKIKSAAAGSGVVISANSSGANESLTLESKGGGAINFITPGSSQFNFKISGSDRLVLYDAGPVFTPSVSSTSNPRFSFTGAAADTAITASNEASHVLFDLAQTRQHATGAISLQRDFRVKGSTHSFVGASTITDAAAFSVDGPTNGGANATLTNSSALLVPTSAVSNVTNAYGLNVAATSGATNNYAAVFTGGNVGIGTTSPTRLLHVAGAMKITPTANPGTPTAGDIFVDSTSSNALKYHNGSSWISIAASSGGDFKADGTVPMTAQLRAFGGTVAAPGLSFVGDTDNGIFAPAADNLAFGTSASEKMRILANGNVGIGTAGPVGNLHVKAATNQNLIIMADGGGYDTGATGIVSSNDAANANVPLYFSASRFNFAGGNVGIGTTSPSRLFQVAGAMKITPTANPATPTAGDMYVDSGATNTLKYHNGTSWVALTTGGTGDFKADGTVNMTGTFKSVAGTAALPGMTFVGDTDNGIFAPAADNLAFGTSASEKMRILANGNVGIGTTSPTAQLQLATGTTALEFNSSNGVINSANTNLLMTVNGGMRINLSSIGTLIRGTTADNTQNALVIENSNPTQLVVFRNDGNVGIGTTGPTRLLQVAGAMKITPTTNPATPTAGDLFVDSGATNTLKYHNGTSWVALTTGGTGDFKADGTVNMTGTFKSVAGTAALPGMTFVGDTDNGIFAPAADNLAIGTSGSEKIRVLANGNVGIGTSTPSTILSLKGTAAQTIGMEPATSGTGNGLTIKAGDGQVGGTNAGGGYLTLSTGGSTGNSGAGMDFRYVRSGQGSGTTVRAPTTGMVFTESGSLVVGNGFQTISDALEVWGAGGTRFVNNDMTVGTGAKTEFAMQNAAFAIVPYAKMQGGVTANTTGAQSGFLAFSTSNAGAMAEKLRITNEGNVGIGTTAPTRLLQVAGAMKITPTAAPATPTAGDLFVDSAGANALKYYNGSAWVSTGGGASSLPAADGTVAAPSINFTNSTGMGLYRIGANILGVSTAGINRLTVDASGNVGIGTTSPAFALQVVGGGSFSGNLNSEGLIWNGGAYINTTTNSATNPAYAFNSGSKDTGFFLPSAGTLGFSTGAAERMRIDSAGNVGIGTTSPSQKLYVNGSMATNNGLIVETTGGSYRAILAQDGPNNGYLDLRDNATASTKVLLSSSASSYFMGGNVGIGTTGPINKFHIVASSNTLADQWANTVYITAPTEVAGTATRVGFGNGPHIDAQIEAGNPIQDQGYLAFRTRSDVANMNERMRINHLGNVGIGTTTPTRLLQVAGAMKITPTAAPATPTAGDLFVDSAGANALKYYNGSAWISTGGGASSLPAADGTVAAPSINFTNSTGMGLYRIGANILGVSTAGINRLTVDASGNVGIGTTSSGAKLAVSDGTTSILLVPGNPNRIGTSSNTLEIGTGANRTIRMANSGTEIWSGTADATTSAILAKNSNGTELLTVRSDGNVGIGITTPTRLLQVAGAMKINPTAAPATPTAGDLFVDSAGANALKYYNGSAWISTGGGASSLPAADGTVAAPSINFTNSTGMGLYRIGANILGVSTAGINRLTVDASGNVGIGTTSPATKFHVIGNPRIEGGLELWGGSVNVSTSAGSYRSGLSINGSNEGWLWATDSANVQKVQIHSNAVSYFNGGNVGIGTTAPSSTLSFGGAVDRTIGVENNVASANGSNLTLAAGNSGGGAANLTGGYLILSAGSSTGFGGSKILFKTASAQFASDSVPHTPATSMIIDHNGFLGIGNEFPVAKLDVNGNTRLSDFVTNPVAGVEIKVDFAANNVAYGKTNFASITAGTTTVTTGAEDGYLRMSTVKAGTMTEALRITKDGYVGIGMTNPSVALDVTGDIEYTGTITDVSDKRLKENITPLNEGLAMIRELPVYSYTMKGDKKNRLEYGVMAQDLRDLVPNLTSVIDKEKGYIGVNYIGLIPWSIRAIQEVDREVASVKAENQVLKSRLDKLEEQNKILAEQMQKLIELHQKTGH